MYCWIFGDGSEAHGVQAVHTYTSEGVFTVTLYVTDSRWGTGYAETTSEIIEPVSVSISAAPSSVEKNGSSVLSWTSAGAQNASVDNGIGAVPVNGSVTVTPDYTTVYTVVLKMQ